MTASGMTFNLWKRFKKRNLNIENFNFCKAISEVKLRVIMYGFVSCGSAAPSWAAAALCIVGLFVVLSCAVCVWRKCLKKKDKDKEKGRGKEKGKEKSNMDLDTEMDGGYSKVRVQRRETIHAHEKHTLCLSPLLIHRPCRVSAATWGSPRSDKTVSVGYGEWTLSAFFMFL